MLGVRHSTPSPLTCTLGYMGMVQKCLTKPSCYLVEGDGVVLKLNSVTEQNFSSSSSPPPPPSPLPSQAIPLPPSSLLNVCGHASLQQMALSGHGVPTKEDSWDLEKYRAMLDPLLSEVCGCTHTLNIDVDPKSFLVQFVKIF